MPTDLKISSEPIVITGMGLVTALGLSVADTWAAVRANRCGAGVMVDMESPLPPGRDGCQAPPLPADYEPDLPREARYLRWTLSAALRDAKIDGDRLPYDATRCAFMLGTTLHGMRAGGRFLRNENYTELRDFLAGDTLRLASAGLGFAGGAATTCSACSSSLGSIALAMTLLESGQADLVVAGGYDAVSEYAWAGFNALRLVAEGPLRPFSRGRTGMKLGEGYGIVVLERRSDALKRGASVQATVLGYGESADAHHLTQPHPTGDGAQRAMRAALNRAKLEPAQLGLIAAHATGTPDNDASEFAALSSLLGDKLSDVPVVCFKSHLGHTLGGAGAAELILSAMAMRDGVAPATANIGPDDVEYPSLRVTTGAARNATINATLNTSLGFGGANTCIVLGTPQSPIAPGLPGETTIEKTPPASRGLNGHGTREVWITGIGVLLPGIIGNDAFFHATRADHYNRQRTPLVDADYEHLLNARRVRRMSTYAKFTLAAASMACRDAALSDRPDLLADTGAILGTTHGSGTYCNDYYAQVVREGVLAGNPVLFAEGVPNGGAAQLSLMLGLKNACQTIIGARTAGMDALRLAWLRIATGACDRTIVSGGEEGHVAIDKAYEQCGLLTHAVSAGPFTETTGFNSTGGAVSFVMESADSARARGVQPYARMESAHALSGDRELLPRTLARLLELSPTAPHVISSACATWIDRIEANALSRGAPNARIGATYDLCGETFSAGPLLGMAAAMLSRSLPTLARPPINSDLTFARPGERVDRFTTLCTDWNGNATAATISLAPERTITM
ncbi:MAG TPA: beta-ketoacyl-[acyl-carrier-protein] synthase family protein [Tepidisphaeraceae bacterium]|nr:beta-ketoacyl-[acyl-carrier-protein] synthase family protein [Tepidisphaeraceae bacterium]